MHGSLRDRLRAQKVRIGAASRLRSNCANVMEEMLAAKPFADAEGSSGHLEECAECAGEFEVFREQAELIRSLRLKEDVEPSPGFYSRVLQRIEARAKKSIWWIFAYSPVGKRLAYVSLATAIVLSSYVVAQETRDGSLYMGAAAVPDRNAAKHHYDIPVAGDVEQQRAAVLANFASHSGTRP